MRKARVWRIDRAAALQAVRRWAEGLHTSEPLMAVVLFGSLARGEATPASDADVLILLEHSEEEFSARSIALKPVGLGVPVDVFAYTMAEAGAALREGWGVVGVALEEGISLRGPSVENLRRRLSEL